MNISNDGKIILDTNIVGRNIKQRRLELGMSQSELAKKMGYKTKGSIAKVECGVEVPRKEKVERFAKALSCDPAELMGWRTDRQVARLHKYMELLLQAYNKAPDKDKKAVCTILDIPYTEKN